MYWGYNFKNIKCPIRQKKKNVFQYNRIKQGNKKNPAFQNLKEHLSLRVL